MYLGFTKRISPNMAGSGNGVLVHTCNGILCKAGNNNINMARFLLMLATFRSNKQLD